MFSDFGIKACNKFIGSEEYQKLGSKNERIHYVLSHFNMDKLVGAAVKAILEKSQKGRKDSQVSSFHLSCAKTLFTSTRNVQQQLEKAEEHASKVSCHLCCSVSCCKH